MPKSRLSLSSHHSKDMEIFWDCESDHELFGEFATMFHFKSLFWAVLAHNLALQIETQSRTACQMSVLWHHNWVCCKLVNYSNAWKGKSFLITCALQPQALSLSIVNCFSMFWHMQIFLLVLSISMHDIAKFVGMVCMKWKIDCLSVHSLGMTQCKNAGDWRHRWILKSWVICCIFEKAQIDQIVEIFLLECILPVFHKNSIPIGLLQFYQIHLQFGIADDFHNVFEKSGNLQWIVFHLVAQQCKALAMTPNKKEIVPAFDFMKMLATVSSNPCTKLLVSSSQVHQLLLFLMFQQTMGEIQKRFALWSRLWSSFSSFMSLWLEELTLSTLHKWPTNACIWTLNFAKTWNLTKCFHFSASEPI